jgi:hypothetical protein
MDTYTHTTKTHVPAVWALCAGAHPNTQCSALAQMVNQLGPDVAAAINQPLPAPTAAAGDASGGGAAAVAAAHSHEHVLQQRAEAAADKLLRRLQGTAQ